MKARSCALCLSEISPSNEFRLQQRIHFFRQVEEAINKKSTHALVDSMAKMLLKGEDRKSSKSIGNDESKVGLFIDWLQMLDPELVECSSDVRLRLLFLRMDKHSKAAATKHLR